MISIIETLENYYNISTIFHNIHNDSNANASPPLTALANCVCCCRRLLLLLPASCCCCCRCCCCCWQMQGYGAEEQHSCDLLPYLAHAPSGVRPLLKIRAQKKYITLLAPEHLAALPGTLGKSSAQKCLPELSSPMFCILCKGAVGLHTSS
jgi:hypothetical protein